jgi:hypothetical protein
MILELGVHHLFKNVMGVKKVSIFYQLIEIKKSVFVLLHVDVAKLAFYF